MSYIKICITVNKESSPRPLSTPIRKKYISHHERPPMSKSPLQVLTADIGRSHHEQEKERLQMGSTKTIGKTIGEVEKLTGIPK